MGSAKTTAVSLIPVTSAGSVTTTPAVELAEIKALLKLGHFDFAQFPLQPEAECSLSLSKGVEAEGSRNQGVEEITLLPAGQSL